MIRQRRAPDAAAELARVLTARACAAGCPARLLSTTGRDWASATFAGTRHVMRFAALPSAALDAWLADLPHADFTLRGHLVADIEGMATHEGDAHIVVIAVLTLVAD